MILHTLKILLLLLIPAFLHAQVSEDGIYLEIEGKRCLFKNIKLMNSETFACVSDQPIISFDQFEDIGAIEADYEKGIRKFSITLSEEGSKRLTTISKIYEGKNLALVTNNRAICLMNVPGVITSGKVIVTEDLNDASLLYVYTDLKDRIKS